MFRDAFKGKTVWVSGHTGFKGAWLTHWLLQLGARVHGYALPPPTDPSVFEQLGLAAQIDHEVADLRDARDVADSIERAQPDFVFHLGAQPLVRLSYEQPVETYQTNVMGTIHVLEALRNLQKPCAAVMVTTDKCYDNREWVHGYREEDAMGGYDPYSSSKGAAEIAISAWRRSFFKDRPVRVASARAGNVIGGGDWAKDRIVPDCIRAIQQGQPVPVRNKTATRPWQHVLEPLSGYLWLGAALANPRFVPCSPVSTASAFNFGPTHDANRTVAELVIEVVKHIPGEWEDRSNPDAVHEANLLQLAIDKANALLGWSPAWRFSDAVRHTVEWYKAVGSESQSQSLRDITTQQIDSYAEAARDRGVAWTLTDTLYAHTCGSKGGNSTAHSRVL